MCSEQFGERTGEEALCVVCGVCFLSIDALDVSIGGQKNVDLLALPRACVM